MGTVPGLTIPGLGRVWIPQSLQQYNCPVVMGKWGGGQVGAKVWEVLRVQFVSSTPTVTR